MFNRFRWSFGGNRLQIKAESRLMADVEMSLRSIAGQFASNMASLPSLASKHDLLTILIENEQSRLGVWLYPLDHERRRMFPTGNPGRAPSDVCKSLPIL